MKRADKIAAGILIIMIIFDTLFTYIFWKSGMIKEENGVMLWALQHGSMYWAIKTAQLILAGILVVFAKTSRLARISVWIIALALIVIYARVAFQVF
jgi:hypothetical protein